MDNGSVWIWVGLALGTVVLMLWSWAQWRKPGTDGNVCSTLKKRFLFWLRAVDQAELSSLKQQLEVQRSELAARLDHLEVTLRHQGRLENWATEVNGRLCRLELSQDPHRKEGTQLHSFSKSMLCLGVRVTLSDQIVNELGMIHPQELPDSQIGQMIQGPFCRNCLRSLVIQNSMEKEKSVRTQCRYCSLAWREESQVPLPLLQIKREVYEYLDAAYRNTRKT